MSNLIMAALVLAATFGAIMALDILAGALRQFRGREWTEWRPLAIDVAEMIVIILDFVVAMWKRYRRYRKERRERKLHEMRMDYTSSGARERRRQAKKVK